MSDIFNDYAKIAIEQGLITEASEVSDETNQRFDSLSDEDIRSLYDVKPNGEEKHILDQAHPESVVVSPAYDKMNGLVENLFERQDIIAWIATKPNDGKHTQERYVKASQDLTMALLNTAFLLDRTGDEELMKLADSCAGRLTKKGIVHLLPIILSGGAGLLGIWGLVNNFGGMLDAGVLSNSERAIEELNDLIEDKEMPGKEEDVQRLIADIEYVKSLNEQLRSFNIEADEDEIKVKAEIANGKALLQKYIKAVRYLTKRINNMLSVAIAQVENQGSSWLSRNIGDLGVGLEKVWEMWWGSDIKDALTILETLRDSLRESVSNMRRLFNVIKTKAKSGNQQEIEELLKVKGTERPDEVGKIEENKPLAEVLQMPSEKEPEGLGTN